MPRRAVVGDDVDDDPDLQGGGVGDESVEIFQGAEPRVNVEIVGDVVAAVVQRRRVEGVQPDGVHSEVGEVGQAGAYPLEVTFTAGVGIGETARIHLVHDGVTPPGTGHSDSPSRL